MTTTPSRRSLLAGAAAVPVLALPAIALPACPEPDPIFAVIDRHRAAYVESIAAFKEHRELEELLPSDKRRSYQICDDYYIWGETGDPRLDTDDPRWIESVFRVGETHDDARVAAIEMTNVCPTTIAGALALLTYIDDFNRGVVHNDSGHYEWPDELSGEDEGLTCRNGRALEMPWPFWVMRNIQAALRSLAA